jgi:uncharacterized protein YndB with AHSA1/START domain
VTPIPTAPESRSIVKETPVVTAATRISASVADVWRVLVAFGEYAQWHPILSLDGKPEQAVVGAKIPGRIAGGDAADQDVTMKIVDVQALRRLVWQGGSLDAILGRHSFVLTPQSDGTTELTDSEESSAPVPPCNATTPTSTTASSSLAPKSEPSRKPRIASV